MKTYGDLWKKLLAQHLNNIKSAKESIKMARDRLKEYAINGSDTKDVIIAKHSLENQIHFIDTNNIEIQKFSEKLTNDKVSESLPVFIEAIPMGESKVRLLFNYRSKYLVAIFDVNFMTSMEANFDGDEYDALYYLSANEVIKEKKDKLSQFFKSLESKIYVQGSRIVEIRDAVTTSELCKISYQQIVGRKFLHCFYADSISYTQDMSCIWIHSSSEYKLAFNK